MNRLLFLLLLAPFSFILNAQCNSWANIPEKEEAEGAHSIYREALKMDDLELAFANWEKAYTLAPAADGLRDYHYMDGVKLYMKRFEAATDKATKDENANIILDLYDKCIDCYRSGGIFIRKCTDQKDCVRQKIAFIRGRQGYNMYYKLVSPKIKTYNILKESLEEGGNDSEYIIIAPLAETMVKLYENGEIETEEFRDVHGKLMAMAKYNSENHPQFASYFQQASDAMQVSVARVERDVYDCQYFKDKFLPLWEAEKTAENAKILYIELVRGGCDENDAELQELHDVYEKWAREDNARKQAEYEAANPIVTAKKLYDSGDYKGAEAKFQEAIKGTDDNTAKAQYLLSLASVQGRKLGKYRLARENAYKAAKLTPNWGSPYMLIGDLYASSSRNCGDAWGQRLAILAAIDKYAYAKSLDPEVAEEAQKKINAYSGSKPSGEEAFMRGFEAGQSVKVGCWIGETVKLRF